MLVKKLFQSEIAGEINNNIGHTVQKITETDIAKLPDPVQKYFRRCGIVGKEKMYNAKFLWKEVLFKTSPEKDFINLDCFQYNFVPEPVRIVYMKSLLSGVIPMEGRDKFQDGHGNMLIKLFKLLKIADAKGKEMDISALVTFLAESLLVPSCALQEYISWSPLNPRAAKAICKYAGIEVCGTFHFNNDFEFILFETDERYATSNGKEYKKMKWSVTADKYVEESGYKFPTKLEAMWDTEHGKQVYFKGTVNKILFNVTE